MSYATPQELADALRIAVTAGNTPQLEACLDAAAIEIDHYVDWRAEVSQPIEPPPEPPTLALLNRVNVLRGVEWWKANDAAFGSIGSEAVGALGAPRDSFATRHGGTLIPAKEQFGVA